MSRRVMNGPAGKAILAGVLVVLLAAGFAVTYRLGRQSQAAELAAMRDEMKSEMAQARAQYEQLAGQMNSLAAARKAEPAEAPTPAENPQAAAPKARATVVRVPKSRRTASDPRFKKLEAQLSEQQKQLAGAQEELKTTREQLQSNLSSTRDELNGSIARNHEELVALQKRGERNYYEFDVAKSKQFQRTGPVGLSLRKADTKHNRFDAAILVNDVKVEKKNVNLNEPVWIYLPGERQPLELVVNQIVKNEIRGYVSEPRYKKSELAAAGAGAAPAPSQGEPQLKSR